MFARVHNVCGYASRKVDVVDIASVYDTIISIPLVRPFVSSFAGCGWVGRSVRCAREREETRFQIVLLLLLDVSSWCIRIHAMFTHSYYYPYPLGEWSPSQPRRSRCFDSFLPSTPTHTQTHTSHSFCSRSGEGGADGTNRNSTRGDTLNADCFVRACASLCVGG